MENRVRNNYMDFLKGIAIIAMVIDHMIADVPKANILFIIIYSFHMPLLFFVAGYIEEYNRDKYSERQRNMLQKK